MALIGAVEVFDIHLHRGGCLAAVCGDKAVAAALAVELVGEIGGVL